MAAQVEGLREEDGWAAAWEKGIRDLIIKKNRFLQGVIIIIIIRRRRRRGRSRFLQEV